MTFLTFPFLIGGCLATAVPVLLHLLLRGKPKQVEFPALMLLKKRLNVNKRSYRLKHLILLALRMLVFVLLGLALARPSVKFADWFPSLAFSSGNSENQGFVSSLAASLGSQDAPIAAAVVVDSSLRMNYVAGNRNRLDVAKEFGRWILSNLPKNSQVAILSSLREADVFQIDMLAAEEKLQRLTITPQGRPVADAVFDALALLNSSELEQRELYVLTDLSEPGWPEESITSLRNLMGNGVPAKESGVPAKGSGVPAKGNNDDADQNQDIGLFVVDVGVDNPNDSALLNVSVSNQIAVAKTPLQIDADLSHLGTEISKTVELLLSDPKSPEKDALTVRGSRTVDFPNGESRRRVSFTLAGFEPGTVQGTLRFTTTDALAVDDQLALTIEVRPPEKLLLVAPPPVAAATLYLRQALETVPYEIETLSVGDLKNTPPNTLKSYRAVFLLDPTPLDAATWKKLADYAASGHGVGVFLGANADSSLTSFNDSAATELLGGKLVRQARRPDGDLWIAPDELQTAVFAPFRRIGPKEEFPWDAPPVFRYWELSELLTKTQIIAPYSDGRPAILAQPVGQGFSLTVTTPVSEPPNLDSPWNQLTRGEESWLFLLLSEGIANYLLGEGERNFNFKSGEHVLLRPSLETMPATCVMATPSGEPIRLTPDTLKREISVATASEPGNYRIRSGGARESLDTGFSVNVPGDEMNLRRIGTPQLDQAFGAENYRLAKTPAEIERNIARRRVGQELYDAVLLLLLTLFAAEYVFSNRFYTVAR